MRLPGGQSNPRGPCGLRLLPRGGEASTPRALRPPRNRRHLPSVESAHAFPRSALCAAANRTAPVAIASCISPASLFLSGSDLPIRLFEAVGAAEQDARPKVPYVNIDGEGRDDNRINVAAVPPKS